MSYVRTPSRRVASRYRRPQAMAGVTDAINFDKMFAEADNAEQIKCIEQANNSTTAKQIDAKIAALNATWQPTGLYVPSDITKLMSMLSDATLQARTTLATLPANAWGITTARSYLDINDARVAAYRKAVAESSGKKIPAPDLKKEVVKSLINVWNAYVTASVITCRLTWMQTAAAIIDRLIEAAKNFVGTVLELAESAAKAIKAPLDIIGWLGKYPYIPVGIVALLVWKKYSGSR